MKKLIAVLLILVGAGFFAAPIISKTILEHKMESVDIDNVSRKQIKINKTKSHKANYDGDKINEIDLNGVILNRDKADMSKVVGQLVVPSIKLNIAIFEGLDNSNLLFGAATMKPHQRFGSGNYTIAGHYTEKKNVLFGGLMDIKVGDIIRTTDKSNIYEFRVIKTEKVRDDRLDLISDDLADKNGKAMITLMTCYYNKPGWRYMVFGEIERIYNYKTEYIIRGL